MLTNVVQKTILFNSEGEMLLLKRSRSDIRRPLQWDFPGGLLDAGEDLETGAIREVVEETGLTPTGMKCVFAKSEVSIWKAVDQQKERNVVRIYYAATTDSKNVVVSDEHCESLWIMPEEAIKIMQYDRHVEVLKHILDNKLEL